MDQRLFIEIGIDSDGNLAPVDNTPYERLETDIYEHVSIERVLDSDENIIESRTKEMTHNRDYEFLRYTEPYELPSDGLYVYQKLIVPMQSHAGEADYYYNDGDLYNTAGEAVTFDDVWENKADAGNLFWFDDQVFSIFNLIECFVLTQHDRLNEVFKNGCRIGCTDSSKALNADFLAAVIFVLNHYVNNRDFYKAQQLLSKLETCNGLCKHVRNQIKGCGCDGKIT